MARSVPHRRLPHHQPVVIVACFFLEVSLWNTDRERVSVYFVVHKRRVNFSQATRSPCIFLVLDVCDGKETRFVAQVGWLAITVVTSRGLNNVARILLVGLDSPVACNQNDRWVLCHSLSLLHRFYPHARGISSSKRVAVRAPLHDRNACRNRVDSDVGVSR